jgi:TRAP-type C4-dicarboxylate transport system substrate-binding protein
VRDLRRPAATCLAGIVAILAVGCRVQGPVGDKAGGVPGGKAVLRLATVSSQLQERPAIVDFIRRVAALSGGNLRVQVVYNWGTYAPDAEQQIVRAVAADRVDLGVVGSRAFDTMGTQAFEALTAPMLVDSYGLEDAVIRSDLGGQMMAGLDPLHVEGLALLAGGVRKPVAVSKPLLGPADWKGIAFGTYRSDVQEEAVRALGATPVVAFGALRSDLLSTGKLQAYEFNLLNYRINSAWSQARFITANVDLWPQMDVLVANPARLEGLSSQQVDWLREAATEAAGGSAALMDRDAALVGPLCREGTRFGEATAADLRWLRRSFAPVYTTLDRDPLTRSFIQRVQAMKRSLPPSPPLVIPTRCRARSRP